MPERPAVFDDALRTEIEAIGRREARQGKVLLGLVGTVAGLSIVANVGDALAGDVTAAGRTLLGIFGVAAIAASWRTRALGWKLAFAWALAQIPVYAWTPDGIFNAQLPIPLVFQSAYGENDVLTSYSAFGINIAGVIWAVWLRAWRDRITGSGAPRL